MDDDKDISLIDDEDIDLVSLNKYLEEDTKRKKNVTAFQIEEYGQYLLKEIDRKKKNKELKKTKLIPYIIKHTTDMYDTDELMSYSFEDVQEIYNDIKKDNRSSLIKFFHFIFDIE